MAAIFVTIATVNLKSIPDFKVRADCFASTVFMVSCGGQCSVALPLGAVGLVVVFHDHTNLLFSTEQNRSVISRSSSLHYIIRLYYMTLFTYGTCLSVNITT